MLFDQDQDELGQGEVRPVDVPPRVRERCVRAKNGIVVRHTKRLGVCDGCGMLSPVVRGVCAMCRIDGVPLRDVQRAQKVCATEDNFGSHALARERALAIRAEAPAEWEAILGPLPPEERPDTMVACVFALADAAE
jgi:hypothetical protein